MRLCGDHWGIRRVCGYLVVEVALAWPAARLNLAVSAQPVNGQIRITLKQSLTALLSFRLLVLTRSCTSKATQISRVAFVVPEVLAEL
jgi:hypothetical protein